MKGMVGQLENGGKKTGAEGEEDKERKERCNAYASGEGERNATKMVDGSGWCVREQRGAEGEGASGIRPSIGKYP